MAEVDGLYGGLFASTGWNRRAAWSPGRKDIVRALRKPHERYAMGDTVGWAEGLWHMALGPAGITEYEDATADEREEVQDLVYKVQQKYSSMSADNIIAAQAAISWANQNVLNRFPENATALANWRRNATEAKSKLRKFLFPTGIVVGVGIVAVLALGGFTYLKRAKIL